MIDAKLKFIKNEDKWDKIVTDLDGNILHENRGILLNPENLNKQYFDDWENQIRMFNQWNIVEVERFL
jgi:hypothetical protein